MSRDVQNVLVTYSLGSCLGLAIYDPVLQIGGMLHCMLPLSSTNKEKAQDNPAMFADTGIVALLNMVLDEGAEKARLVVKAAGCGAPMDTTGRFKIGDRNYAVLRKILWKNNLLIESKDIGGTKPRTLRLDIGTGETTVSSQREVVTI